MNVKGGLRNAITEKRNEVSPVQAMGDLLKRMHTQIEKALPSVITPERFTRIALTAYSRNEKLQECTAESFLGSMMQAAQLGVEPNTPLGQAYLIPFRNRGVMEAIPARIPGHDRPRVSLGRGPEHPSSRGL